MRDCVPVPLTPKVFDTLLVLMANSGHLVEKDELMQRLWPDTFVEEATLARNISDFRKALGGASNGQKYIDTVPKRGYRFVATVRESCDERTEWLVEKATKFPRVTDEDEESSAGERYAAEAEQAIQEKALAAVRFEKSAYTWRVVTMVLVGCLLLVVLVATIRTVFH